MAGQRAMGIRLPTTPEQVATPFQSGTTRHAPALLSRYGADWQYVHIPGAESLLLPSGQPSGPPLNLAASHPQIVQENLAYLLSERMRHNDETLARKMVWDYYP